ncbi:unnamed protein product [Amoebophrya sp. A25]|nr:unnamed protein product [Amoebophrya sp. A25]|eukprot:GSA25T00008600001.1
MNISSKLLSKDVSIMISFMLCKVKHQGESNKNGWEVEVQEHHKMQYRIDARQIEPHCSDTSIQDTITGKTTVDTIAILKTLLFFQIVNFPAINIMTGVSTSFFAN